MKQAIFIFFVSVISLFADVSKFESRNKIVTAHKTVEGLKVDGKLTENIYNLFAPANDFTQRDPEEGKPATESTLVWVFYDDDNLYLSAKMKDSKPELIDASLMRRDNMSQSDWLFIYIDPFLDRRNGYYFAVNAGGSIADGILFNDSWDDNSWDGIWEAKANIDNEGWTCEIKIPFSQLRFNESDDMKWGINFNRDLKRLNENTWFVMVPKNESGFVSRFATLEGLKDIKPKTRIEALPYVVQKAQYLVHDKNDPFYKSNQYRTSFGGDFKLGLGSNMNLDLTINPDFGQVEVDPAVINLSAFETYYQEKRPFFIEGSTNFIFGVGGANNNWGFNFGNPELFYTRRIGRSPQGYVDNYDYADYPKETRILGAAKLTGKIGDSWTLGAVSAFTERTFTDYKLNNKNFEKEVEPFTHYGVFRAKKEFNEGRHSIGFILTTVNRDLQQADLKSSLVDQAYSFGVDGWTTLDEEDTYVVNGSFVGSYVSGSKEAMEIKQRMSYRYFQRPDASYAKLDTNLTSMAGWFSRIMLNKQKGNFYINTAIGLASPTFEYNDLGFQWAADRINSHLVLGYRWYEPDGIFRNKQLYMAHFRTYNFDGNILSNGLMSFFSGTFQNYYNFNIQANYNFEAYSAGKMRGGPLSKDFGIYGGQLRFRTDGREKIIGEIEVASFDMNKGGSETSLGIGIEWKPNSQINFGFMPVFESNDYEYQWIGKFDDETATATYGKRYVFGHMIQKTLSANFRLNWTFTPQLSLQIYLQPLISAGKYSDFSEFAKPGTNKYRYYGKNGSTIMFDQSKDVYIVDPDGSGNAESFEFGKPDFNFKSIRANVVLRYEVLPGSVLYLVWNHDKTNFANQGRLKFSDDINNLWNSEANNILMLKFSYWLDV
ncbi:MAG: hypothetical protein CO129_01590 [Ignavibacteriales bacterium CG_4_9_14_3_um_filter_34_10]|nr:MAG: hypothetical protein CO129_01590 [Ignavibacteriales bacterium CG_4_9_14_3_um_filter_34_10]